MNCEASSRFSRAATVAACVLVWASAHAQEAQPLPPSTITTSGKATVEAAPDRAEFWLYFKLTGATLLEAAEAAQSTEEIGRAHV